uniref:protein-serine/threonine phosphatase n=1 Tax=Noctiluca scintillans TaxID=2966 RepID=A0A7S1F5P1_NOCSC|mmetsp:Transcript_34168/g.91169  ORF Transcript_34168/g.91169 Transcript_34168/m.91169 type:complete len:435 (+) Transcript_34168:47-1351(+)
MKILFRPPEKGKKDDVELDVNPDELMESVRRKVQAKVSDWQCHKLIHQGVTLRDDRTLRYYGVAEGSCLIVQGQYYGQYLPMGVTPNMERKRTAEEALSDAQVEGGAPPVKRPTATSLTDLEDAEVAWIGVRCATWGDKGMRRQMEDEHLICASLREHSPSLSKERDCALFAIFDGHGGKQVAGFIKTCLAVELANAFAAEEGSKDEPLSDKRLKKATEATFQRLDSRIASELTGCYDGCTAIVLLVSPEQVVCLNLGDSMAYLCRRSEEDIQAIPLQMRQHKCWMMKEKERILRAGGAVENGRINGVLEVSRAFGDITLKKYGVLCTPDYMKFKIDRTKDEFVLLGCDGFWNAWTAAEALEFASDLVQTEEARASRDGEALDLKSCCRELVQHVVEEKKAQDNVSVLIIQFVGRPAEMEEAKDQSKEDAVNDE